MSRPRIAYGPTGTLHVAYPQRAAGELGKAILMTHYTRSTDGGQHSRRRSGQHGDRLRPERRDPRWLRSVAFGTMGVAPTAAYIAWIDTRNMSDRRPAGTRPFRDDGRVATPMVATASAPTASFPSRSMRSRGRISGRAASRATTCAEHRRAGGRPRRRVRRACRQRARHLERLPAEADRPRRGQHSLHRGPQAPRRPRRDDRHIARRWRELRQAGAGAAGALVDARPSR